MINVGWMQLPGILWVGLLVGLSGCTQTVGVQGQLLVVAAPQIDPANPGLARFQSGPAQTKLEVVPDSKIVKSMSILQGPHQQLIKLKGVNWGQGSLLVHLTQDQLHGSLRLDWVHDSQPLVSHSTSLCTFSGICAYEAEVEVEKCDYIDNVYTCSKHKETRSEYGHYDSCSGEQEVAVTEQYSHAMLRLQLKDVAGSQLDFNGQSSSELFELDRQTISECR
ncbi:hypothetical protein EOE67_15300 [Rheinheimera riviphila]|uniref:Uncharacterized protein n=1 Tax=Rheinheimera riviphila TaxID=1834037 RepID=A0A437QIV2_9GAMM|nr:hypothetical protein [Rheinheimera riviphila]RVU34413.1 hypothetical protein EOE67_15300 [Rheinheimera riviphila]